MALDWSQCSEVSRSPDVMSGAWVFKGSRLTVDAVLGNYADGHSVEELLEIFDTNVTAAQMRAVIRFAEASGKVPALAS